MSGTSLDGLDMALCDFHFDKHWSFQIVKSKCVSYDEAFQQRLLQANSLNEEPLMKFHHEFGDYIGQQVNNFIDEKYTIDYVCSHGHTIFHQPENGITFQLGHGANIASTCGITAISDFRTKDVSLGGQGAPLVPIGDLLLFDQYKYCLNLGGFANISIKNDEKITAFDICPANMPLNYLANQLNKSYDENGNAARFGKVHQNLLDQLNSLDFYDKKGPRSLGKEWFDKSFKPLLDQANVIIEDKLSTCCVHIASKIAKVLCDSNITDEVLITGGGAYNQFLIELIQLKSPSKITLPNPQIIDFKEALIFGFLGVLKATNQINTLSDVTGASKDSSGGCVYGL